jgi:hypothetical protein
MIEGRAGEGEAEARRAVNLGCPASTPEGIPSWAEGNPSQSEGNPNRAEGNPSRAEGNPNVCPSVKSSPLNELRPMPAGGLGVTPNLHSSDRLTLMFAVEGD